MLRGFIYAVTAACTYGLIALFSMPLLAEGLSYSTINALRFGMAGLMVMLFVLMRKKTWRIICVCKMDMLKFFGVSSFYALTALSFMAAFKHMDTGIVVTVQYCYPIFVVFCMVAFFGETFRLSSFIASVLIVIGVAVFSLQDLIFGTQGVRISLWGMVLTLFCSTQMALYVIGIQVAKFKCQNDFVTAMYIMLITGLYCALYGVIMGEFSLPEKTSQWQQLLVLALVTGAVSNLCLVFAVRYVGSTLTAILGGLEPVTGMLAGVYLLGEQASWGNVLGTICILGAVALVAVASQRQKPKFSIENTVKG